LDQKRLHCSVTGWGRYLPQRCFSNDQFEKSLDTTSEWIESRTGILKRYFATENETTSSMCQEAATIALSRAGVKAADLDLIICATTTPDYLLPNTAALLQRRIGAAKAGAFDLNSACTGFLYAMIVGAQFIQAGTYRRVLVTAGETLSRFLNWKDRSTCVLFGDGASAAVLEASEGPLQILSTQMGCIGDTDLNLNIKAGGSAHPATPETIGLNEHVVSMNGREVFKLAVGGMHKTALRLLETMQMTPSDIGMLIPHQANLRIISAVGDALGLDEERIFSNVQQVGNVGAASVGIALSEYLDCDQLKKSGNLMLLSFGGGFTSAGTMLRWV
jgi:3-oxoacyl-[acyl-carrier-protein] synthase-3